MSNDILTMYTKEENQKNGRKGYCLATREKETSISPDKYGSYILNHRKKKK